MEIVDLSGEWELRQKGKKEAIPARIPGDILSALVASGAAPDPYFAREELAVQWVGREDWVLSRSFSLPEALARKACLFLHFESIDTCAEVRLNDKSVGVSRNMFVRRRFDVAGAARSGENRIEVHLSSPEREAEAESGKLPYPIPHNEFPVQSPHRNLIRKVQCHSGWDWGPCLMVSGLYGRVHLGASSSHRIEYVHTRQRRKSDRLWEVEVTVEIVARREQAATVVAALSGKSAKREVVLKPGEQSVALVLPIDNPELWWPAGSGEQPLYELTVSTEEDELRKRIAFRRLEVAAIDDERGRSMTFRVNGRNLFCKGANWIPTDALPSRQTREVYEELLQSAVDANMNMLRVWGGGQYEADEFYELCDEKGLLVWQDFMFACSTYPASPDFLANVRAEVVHQVKRLKDHPSIALWCGNNENLGALGLYPETRKDRDRYLVDYDRLYEGTIGATVEALDPERTFWPSSPSGGRGDYSDGWHDDSRGDMHYWSVWHEGRPFAAYYDVTPRFCSEFGFQSFPSVAALDSFVPPGQRNLTSPVMEHHQRHPRGNSVIIESLSRYFRFPEGIENFLYLSQVQQALAVRTAVEYWRSRRPDCMGALYWQLNDLWPVASWSSIEYGGKWKLLHYAARRFFRPVHLCPFVVDGRIEVWGCNDTATTLRGRFALDFLSFSGALKESQTQAATLKAEAATRLASIELSTLSFAPRERFLRVGFHSGDLAVDNELFLAYPKECELLDPEIRMEIRGAEGEPDGTAFTVELSAERPAFYVALDAGATPGRFDDNCFTLIPGRAKVVRFLPRSGSQSGATRGEVRLYHLQGSYR